LESDGIFIPNVTSLLQESEKHKKVTNKITQQAPVMETTVTKDKNGNQQPAEQKSNVPIATATATVDSTVTATSAPKAVDNAPKEEELPAKEIIDMTNWLESFIVRLTDADSGSESLLSDLKGINSISKNHRKFYLFYFFS
jgi:hypothetical protein